MRATPLTVAALIAAAFSLSSVGASAQTQPPAATVQPGAQNPSDRQRADFLESMSRIPLPAPLAGKGCFKAQYPNKIWIPIKCAPPPGPNPRALVPRHDLLNVGGGTDYFVNVSGSIASAIGTLDPANTVTKVYSPTYTTPPTPTVVHPNDYTLQINSNTFSSPLCNGVPNCVGWQQFVFSQRQCGGTACVFVQYWLLNHPQPCPPNPTFGTWVYSALPGTTPGCWLEYERHAG